MIHLFDIFYLISMTISPVLIVTIMIVIYSIFVLFLLQVHLFFSNFYHIWLVSLTIIHLVIKLFCWDVIYFEMIGKSTKVLALFLWEVIVLYICLEIALIAIFICHVVQQLDWVTHFTTLTDAFENEIGGFR